MYELALKMIAVSDNMATNILIDRLGMENINLGLDNFGFTETRLNRKMMDFEAIREGRQNYITVFEVNKMLWGLLAKRILKPKSSKKALEILLKCEDVTTIPRKIPKTVPIAHKSGTLDYVRGDAGILFSGEPVILTIFVQNFESLEQAEKIIGEIAEIAYLTYGK
jgi:beta-lactamase class A